MPLYLVWIGFSSVSWAELSYYDKEPCSQYKGMDYPVALFPWEEMSSGVMAPKCDWSVDHVNNLVELGGGFVIASMESAVAQTVSNYVNAQKGIARTLLCCIDQLEESLTQSVQSHCEAARIKAFCKGSGQKNSFPDYLEDLNQRLQAVRIAAYRMNSKNKNFENANKKFIDFDRSVLLEVLGSISGDNLISLGRYPEKLDPLTSDEIKLAETYLRPKDSPTLSVPPKKFGYGNFISDQPTKDYFMLIAATPFLAEVASSNINPSDLRIYLNQYLARNPQNEVKFGHFYYNDFMGLISDKIKLNKDSSSQRDQCKYAEFRLKLGNAEIVTLKEIPLALALAYSGLKGGRGNPAKTPPWEIVKKIGKSLSNTAPPAITLSKSVDLLEKARIDRYCSVRFSDKNLSMSAPLCKQYEILATLDEIQSSMIMSASVMGGFMMFRYGTGQVSSWLKETLGPLPKNKADFW